mmetsp:Transcript_35423/g.71782  ORF Transcript_35423/g.71782 Transcript_35423/m.71782 type:complete len:203 (+) Transcript_35423:1169-1777(+)
MKRAETNKTDQAFGSGTKYFRIVCILPFACSPSAEQSSSVGRRPRIASAFRWYSLTSSSSSLIRPSSRLFCFVRRLILLFNVSTDFTLGCFAFLGLFELLVLRVVLGFLPAEGFLSILARLFPLDRLALPVLVEAASRFCPVGSRSKERKEAARCTEARAALPALSQSPSPPHPRCVCANSFSSSSVKASSARVPPCVGVLP